MIAPRVSAEDAIRIYALAISYLHDARIGNSGPASAMRAKAMTPTLFYIWHREHYATPGRSIAPVATCTYNKVAQTWKVELITGETLTLYDKGNVWDIVENEKRRPDTKVVKKTSSSRTRRHE